MEPISIVIPVRVDTTEREENLHCVLKYLLQTPFVHVDILEADNVRHFYFQQHQRIRYRFIQDSETVFYRTHYLNLLLKEALYPIAGVWDTDVLIPEEQLIQAVEYIRRGCVMCFPYDGAFRFLDRDESCLIRSDMHSLKSGQGFRMMGRPSVGGAFLVNRLQYLEAGGENEGFYGWGPEDVERVKRLEILGLPISRIQGALYHLYHERKPDTGVDNQLKSLHNQKVLFNTCNKSGNELRYLIQNRLGVFSYLDQL